MLELLLEPISLGILFLAGFFAALAIRATWKLWRLSRERDEDDSYIT